MVRHLFLLLCAALAGGGSASAQATLPQAIETFTRENLEACRSAGGRPGLSGIAFPGADLVSDGRPPYVTEIELNGDGLADFITDLTGLECAGAWSYFCGSAGCPVTVWLSGPGGHSVAWGGHAQGWESQGTEVVLFLHGQLCTPPRIGADSCEFVLDFDGETGEAPQTDPAEQAALAPERSLRPKGKPAEEAAPMPRAAAPQDVPTPDASLVPAWASGQMPDRSGWFAGVADGAAGRRVDWLCAKGRQSLFALSPYDGGPRIAIDVGGRVQEFDIEVVNGAGYAPIEIAAPIFLHIVSGPAFTISEPGGPSLGTFTMEGAPRAIGQAEGRCRFEALTTP